MINLTKLSNRRQGAALALLLAIQIALVLAAASRAAGEHNEFLPEGGLYMPTVQSTPNDPDVAGHNCRYGIAVLGNGQLDWLEEFAAGWHLNFGVYSLPASNGAEFVPIVRVEQNKTPEGVYLPSYTVIPELNDDNLGHQIDLRPGALWIVGNEVDRGPDPGMIEGGQGDIFPALYAEAYHEVYHYIKERDPSAKVGISGLVEVTPGRLQYLDITWDTYRQLYGVNMPVDVWNMHLYILPEALPNGQPNGIANIALGTDPGLAIRESGLDPAQCPLDSVYCYAEHDDVSIFVDQVVAMRSWMRDRGLRDKPLILSEFSLLYPYIPSGQGCYLQDEYGNCFTPERVTAYLNATFDYLESAVDPELGYPLDENRLVQQWLWFSMNNTGYVGDVSDLVRDDQLTMVGQAFKDYVLARPMTLNLFPDRLSYTSAFTEGGTADVELWATLRNNGNDTPRGELKVTFYSDPFLTVEIGSYTIPAPGDYFAGATGCARNEIRASTTWNDLTAGVHQYWVKVDSNGQYSESNESDNVASGYAIVNPQRSLLPLVTGE
jgi:hypothetical protein